MITLILFSRLQSQVILNRTCEYVSDKWFQSVLTITAPRRSFYSFRDSQSTHYMVGCRRDPDSRHLRRSTTQLHDSLLSVVHEPIRVCMVKSQHHNSNAQRRTRQKTIGCSVVSTLATRLRQYQVVTTVSPYIYMNCGSCYGNVRFNNRKPENSYRKNQSMLIISIRDWYRPQRNQWGSVTWISG